MHLVLCFETFAGSSTKLMVHRSFERAETKIQYKSVDESGEHSWRMETAPPPLPSGPVNRMFV